MNERKLLVLRDGARLIVRKERQINNCAILLGEHDRDIYITEIPNSSFLLITIDRCVVEDLGPNPRILWDILNYYGPTTKALYNQMCDFIPHIYRYVTPRESCFLFATSAQGIEFSLMVNDHTLMRQEEQILFQSVLKDVE